MFLLLAASRARALFSVEYSIKNNVLRSGTLSVTFEPAESLLSANAMTSGSSVTNKLTVENNGTIPAKLSVSAKKSAGYTTFFNAVNLTVKQGERIVFSGPTNELQNIPLSGETLAVGSKNEYWFTATLPAESTNSLANSYANITFVITATESS